MGGISIKSGVRPPGKILFAINPAISICRKITPNTVIEADIGILPNMINITASSGAQGIPRRRRNDAIFFSLFVSSIRVVRIAMVTHEKPITSGMTLLPLRPIF
jgi:hypothetical protein